MIWQAFRHVADLHPAVQFSEHILDLFKTKNEYWRPRPPSEVACTNLISVTFLHK